LISLDNPLPTQIGSIQQAVPNVAPSVRFQDISPLSSSTPADSLSKNSQEPKRTEISPKFAEISYNKPNSSSLPQQDNSTETPQASAPNKNFELAKLWSECNLYWVCKKPYPCVRFTYFLILFHFDTV
jgi:hypothetical protein